LKRIDALNVFVCFLRIEFLGYGNCSKQRTNKKEQQVRFHDEVLMVFFKYIKLIDFFHLE